MRSIFIAGLAAILAVSAASAQEVTLRAVSSFAEGTEFSKNFERFVEKVNNDGKGVIKINYIGGPRAVPPFEVGNAVRTRVVDIANVTGAFYTNLMPEADGFKLIGKPMSEQRATAPGSSSINCTTRSSIPSISPVSSTMSRFTSISTRRSTRSISRASRFGSRRCTGTWSRHSAVRRSPPRRARSTPHWSAAWSTATAGR